ncbi:LysM peptidoglycan-binding domain-containing protein [Sinimarinibacterium sp. CAU 1509]|uniref:LysM peptidoglycan-binding domain-containing protein n=1 Tax=Sinimarinibacterium sp. CAU 1509 TaxID=2562283 RepID=UPI00146BA13A|nr:LysM domain-containing protein [Sinimarinibacterium sp. CAU 1509]
MSKYNDSATISDSAAPSVCKLAFAAVTLLAGCAQTPERTVSEASAPVEAAQFEPAAAPVAPAEAAPVSVRADAPLRYIVKKGDTLWDIAAYFLNEPWQWPEIWYANDQIANPHLIYPGDVLTLVWRDGRPMLTRDQPLRVDRVSPQVRELPLDEAIPTIPIEKIRDFLRGPRVVGAKALDNVPYVLAFGEAHLVEGEGSLVYLKRMPKEPAAMYQGVRQGKKYIDPVTRRFLGWEVVPVADIQIQMPGDVATGLITRSYRETRPGDLLIEPPMEHFESNFFPHPAPQTADVYIISVFEGVSQIGQYNVVTLNRGAEDGIEVGHVFDVMQAGRKAQDPYTGRQVVLPERYAGELMVFRVEDRVSYALVMRAEHEMHVLDRARAPDPYR